MAADIHVHLFAYGIDEGGDYQIPATVGLGDVGASGSVHNHGDTDLTVSAVTADNESNCSVEISSGPSLFEPIAPDASEMFSLTITPTAYAAYSFDLVFASNDTDSPLTVTFEGRALGPAEGDEVWRTKNRQRHWTARNRRRHWTISG